MEKYQQRLQAIAEKRRLQEEQEKAKREMEEERLRLQQLKRKSLRDQWLMDAPPQSPTSPDSQGPRSPLWGSQAKEIEQRIDKLQTESQRLAEEEMKLKEQMEDGQMEAAAVVENCAEAVQKTVVENGQVPDRAESALEAVEGEVVKNLGPLLEGAANLTNGRGEGEGQEALATSGNDGQPITNGADGAVTMTFVGLSEAEPGQVPMNGEGEEEEEEGTIMMRAERVIITEESDEAVDDLSPQGQAPQPSSHPSEEEEEAGDTGATEPESVPEPSTELEKEGESEKDGESANNGENEKDGESEKEGITVGAETSGEAGEVVEKLGVGDEGETGEVQRTVEAPTSTLQSPTSAVDGAVVDVPVYSNAQPALASSPMPDAKGEAAKPGEENQVEEGGEAASAAQAQATLPGEEFQEVSLAEPRTEAVSVEQEPLLVAAKVPQTYAGTQAETTGPPETLAMNRGQGGDPAPKRKTCQCCSIM